MSLYLRQVGVIVWKDLLLELRTRERFAAMGAFAVLAGVLFNFSTDTSLVRPQDIAAGLIWMTLVFDGLLGVGRTFHMESEDGALQGLLMSPAPKDAIFLGKTISNFALLFVVALLVLGVFMLFFGLEIGSSPLALLLALGLGSLGFVALGTLFSAVSAGTRMGETVLPILVFPLLVPMVIYGAGATGRLLAGRPVAEVAGNLRMLGAFALVALAAGAALFRFVVED
ncbi:MAG: cytochrome C biogenesis protein [Gemmatimonadetes bacterium]|nr:cytochrome C biogenesis protein [Gemmatimonadota bacterium]